MSANLRTLALEAIQSNPAHHLRLGLRQLVWAEFGPRATPENYLSHAHRQRITLAVAGVERVLPIWQPRYPNSEIPFDALAAVAAVLGGEATGAAEVFDALWEGVVHLSMEDPANEIAVGFAAVQALSTAMYDEFFDADDLDPRREDGDDPESHDSAYYAASAAANGPPDSSNHGSELRKEFWNWWLAEALELARKSKTSQR